MADEFSQRSLAGARFHKVDLAAATFEDVSLAGARFDDADFSGVKIRGAFCSGTSRLAVSWRECGSTASTSARSSRRSSTGGIRSA